MSETIGGFDTSAWAKFLRPIEKSDISRDPNGMDYVKHQVCIGMLNECFGVNGWTQEVKETWFHDGYTYTGKDRQGNPQERIGRAYAEVLVRLTIHKPGSDDVPVTRENIGAQVAGGDWSETRKGAVSEGLKRAASLLGWAGNVYRVESFQQWEEATPAPTPAPAAQQGRVAPLETPADDVASAQYNADGTPANPAAERHQRTTCAQAVVDHETFLQCMAALHITDPKVLAKAKAAAGLEHYEYDQLDVDALRHVYTVTEAKLAEKKGRAA